MPYVFSLVGSWPPGITINSATGVVSGTPTLAGTYTGLSVRVTDDAMNTADLPTFSLAVTVGPSYGLAAGTSAVSGVAPYASVGSAAGVGTAAAVGDSDEGDPFWDDVLFLSGFEGLNGYNSPLLDDTGQWLMNTGGTFGQLSTSRFESGGSSHFTNHSGTGYSTPRDVLWGLVPTAASEFTFEFSVNWTSTNGGDLITLAGAGGAEIWIRFDSVTGHVRMLGSKTGSGFPVDYTSSGGSYTPTNNWIKYCIEKNAAGKYRTYIDGVMRGSQTVLDTLYGASDIRMDIGAGFNTPQNVWIDNMRITLAARYDDDGGYTPTSGVFPSGAMRSNWDYRSSANDTTDGTTYTFTSMAIGNNADTYRLVVAVIHWGYSTTRTLSSATIGGVAATIVGQVNNAGGFRGIAIVQAVVPTGTTATVAVTFSGGVLRCLVDIYSGMPMTQSALDSQFIAYSGLGSGVTATYTDIESAAGGITILGNSGGDTTNQYGWTYSGSGSVVQDSQAGVESGRYGAFHILNTDTSPLNDLTLGMTTGGGGNGGVIAIASYGGVVPAILYTHAASMTSGGTGTDNFSNVNIGAPRSDRVVVVYVMHSRTLAAVNDSLTVNGVSMTEVPGGGVSASGGNVGDLHAWYGSVPSGTSVTVSVHFSTISNSFIDIWVYSLYGSPALLDTVRVTGGSAGTSIGFSDLDTMTGGPVLLCGYSVGSGATTVTGATWTGPETFAVDSNIVCLGNNHSAFTGHFTAANDGAGTDDITVALNSSRVNAGIALSFIPFIVTSSVGLAAGTGTVTGVSPPLGTVNAVGSAAGTSTATAVPGVDIRYIGELTPGTPTNGASATLDVGTIPGLVVVAINISRTTGFQKVTSVTINGESAIVQAHTLTNTRVAAIASKTTMADTGSIVVSATYNGTTATLRGSVYMITGLQTARPLDVEALVANNPSITLAIAPNGGLIADAVNNDNAQAVTFSAGVDTQDFNSTIGSFSARGVGHSLTTTSNASYNVTTSSGAGTEWMSGASWDASALGSRTVYWYGVGLLCHFDGADAATSSTNSSDYAHTLTFGGNAQLDTAKFKFGGSSLLLDGTGDYVSTAITTDLYLAGFDFTIDCWAAFHSVSVTQTVLSNYTASGNQRAWFLQWEQTLLKLRFAWYPDGITFDFLLDSSSWTPTIDQLYHLRVDRKNGVFRMYIDGVMVASNSSFTTSVLFESTAPFMIGGINATTGNFNGWIDEVLVLKGLGLCGSDAGFTPPTSAYTAVSGVGASAGIGTAAAVSPVTVVRLGAQYAEVISSGSGNTVRLGDQYAEVISSGSGNTVRLGDQYAEVISSGSGNLVRIGDQYAEVIVPGDDKGAGASAGTAAVVGVSNASVIPPDYANAGGTGNRAGIITVTSNFTMAGSGGLAILIDGSQANSAWFPNAQSNLWIQFDFGSGSSKVISEITWYQDIASGHGNWALEGSQDATNWQQLSSSVNLGASTATGVYPQDWDTNRGYRYYRLKQVTGQSSSSPYTREIEFKIGDATAAAIIDSSHTSFQNTGGAGDRTASITVTTDATTGAGTLSNLVDGAFAQNSTDSWWWTATSSNVNITFDFGSSKIVTAISFLQSTAFSHGNFKAQGSPDNSTWTDLMSAINFSPSRTVFNFPSNSTAYRYYRLLKTSGTTSTTPWLMEVEFSII